MHLELQKKYRNIQIVSIARQFWNFYDAGQASRLDSLIQYLEIKNVEIREHDVGGRRACCPLGMRRHALREEQNESTIRFKSRKS
jgi:hypothetical protein